MVKKINPACKHFPCHRRLEDCTFCYCPFYPCLNKRRGTYVHSKKLKMDVWSCRDCSWIHKKSTVNILTGMVKNSGYAPQARRRGVGPDKTGVIILGHGSKSKEAKNTIPKTVMAAKKRLSLPLIEPAYLQLCDPDLTESVRKLSNRGCERIVIVPFFLFVGNHVRRDIPAAIEKVKALYPEVTFIYTENLSNDIRIAEVTIDIIKRAIHHEGN